MIGIENPLADLYKAVVRVIKKPFEKLPSEFIAGDDEFVQFLVYFVCCFSNQTMIQ